MVNVIAVLVAFIPTGLPVAVTLSLLLMARKMAKYRVLVKNLSTIETLSCVNVIASDKTGTLTQNKMFVGSVAAGAKIIEMKQLHSDSMSFSSFKQLIAVSRLCNNSSFIDDLDNKKLSVCEKKAKGDATDIALLRFSAEFDQFSNLTEDYIQLAEIPFNSKNKWMMKLLLPKDLNSHNEIFAQNFIENQSLMLLKGAPDILLRKCKSILEENGSERPINGLDILNLIKIQNEWCLMGQRVILICRRYLNNVDGNELSMKTTAELENNVNSFDNFCLMGMLGIIDPPREGVADVVMRCRGAGIRVFMVTGDYALTAAAIATKTGIFTNQSYDTLITMREKYKQVILEEHGSSKSLNQFTSLLINGAEMESLIDEDWRIITKYEEIVLARTSPEQKLKTVKEFRKDGYIVAVTGDGVNDAPALKSADIGIAMGAGSEVAMEAAQLVLLDNNFSSILIAIENGRLVFANLRKVILYLLPAGSFAEVIPILANIFLGIPLPLSAFLMICICILTG